MSDLNYEHVSLLLPMNGANNGTVFTDYSPTPKIMTRINAVTSTAKSKYYGSSGRFDGSNDYLTTPDHADFNFGADKFCIEGWFNESVSGVIRQIIGQHTVASNANSSFLILSDNRKITFQVFSGSSIITAANPTSHSLDTFHHFRAIRDGIAIKLYINDNEVASGVIGANTINNSSMALSIGTVMGNSGREPAGYDFNGHMNDLRITRTVTRITSPLTPQGRLLQSVKGIIRDINGAPAERTVYVYNRDTGALAGSATSDGVTGEYETLVHPGVAEAFRVVLANETSLYNDLTDRVIPE